ncbi:MAG: endonuclease III [Clostridia bacterium]|nr:endonuclease III [Clostridia bacterium]
MTNKQKTEKIISLLEERYPEVKCGLDWGGEDEYKLLIMSILSAQCTDARVNIVSKTLFERFPTACDMAKASLEDIENEIRSVGLYHSKARALKECCERLVEVYGGKLPSEMKELLTLRGVGRKVANLLRGDIFNLGGIVADTHCIRISNRLGLASGSDPLKTEKALSKLIPTEKQSDFCHRIVMFGREVCTARTPKCDECTIKQYCEYKK